VLEFCNSLSDSTTTSLQATMELFRELWKIGAMLGMLLTVSAYFHAIQCMLHCACPLFFT
jgi:hypothetical protein